MIDSDDKHKPPTGGPSLADYLDRSKTKPLGALFGSTPPDPKTCSEGLCKCAAPEPKCKPFIKIERIKGAPAMILGVKGEF